MSADVAEPRAEPIRVLLGPDALRPPPGRADVPLGFVLA